MHPIVPLSGVGALAPKLTPKALQCYGQSKQNSSPSCTMGLLLMPDIVVRPSTKLVRPFYYVAVALTVAIYFWNRTLTEPLGPYIYILPAVIFLVAAFRHFELRFATMTIAAG